LSSTSIPAASILPRGRPRPARSDRGSRARQRCRDCPGSGASASSTPSTSSSGSWPGLRRGARDRVRERRASSLPPPRCRGRRKGPAWTSVRSSTFIPDRPGRSPGRCTVASESDEACAPPARCRSRGDREASGTRGGRARGTPRAPGAEPAPLGVEERPHGGAKPGAGSARCRGGEGARRIRRPAVPRPRSRATRRGPGSQTTKSAKAPEGACRAGALGRKRPPTRACTRLQAAASDRPSPSRSCRVQAQAGGRGARSASRCRRPAGSPPRADVRQGSRCAWRAVPGERRSRARPREVHRLHGGPRSATGEGASVSVPTHLQVLDPVGPAPARPLQRAHRLGGCGVADGVEGHAPPVPREPGDARPRAHGPGSGGRRADREHRRRVPRVRAVREPRVPSRTACAW
jgi:hypothetical protein